MQYPMTHESLMRHLEEFAGHADPEILRAFLDEVPLHSTA